MSQIIYTVAANDADLYGILQLQRENLATTISREEALAEGFVTVEHNFPLLKKMNAPYPHIIAKDGDEVIGYTLVMLRTLRDEIPILIPMYEQIDMIEYDGRLLNNSRYFVMGQVCIAKGYRGMGVFPGLYEEMAKRMCPDFEYIITEVSLRNQRSLRAHHKVGFQTIKEFRSDDGEDWAIVLWRISNR